MAKKEKAKPFVMISKKMLSDPKYRKLSTYAKVLYLYMRNKLNSKYELKIVLTYKEMNDIMSNHMFSKSKKELIREGFIREYEKGGMYGNANIYEFVGEYRSFYYKGIKIT